MTDSVVLRVGITGALAAALVLAHTVEEAAAVETLPHMDEYTITFWWAPPVEQTTPERYAEIAAAGFNLVCPPAPSEPGVYHPYFTPDVNRKVLDLCEAEGMKALVADTRVLEAFHQDADWQPLLDAVVADYREHPALAGYYLLDEPDAGKFEKLGEMAAYLRAIDPDHYSYINLFPNYAPAEVLGAPDYRGHVERYVDAVDPPFICYDNYHFLDPLAVRGGEGFASEAERRLFDIAHATGPREQLFFENLDIVRDVARERGIPFMVIVLLVPHGPYRELGEAELRWEAFQCLAHGASGVSYFSYWAPPYEETWKFRDAAFTFEGAPTERYDALVRINRDLRAYGNALLGRACETVVRLGEGGAFEPAGGVARVEGGPVTAGLFDGGYLLLANRDVLEAVRISVTPDAGKRLEVLRPDSGAWDALPDGGVRLPPGDAALLRVKTIGGPR